MTAKIYRANRSKEKTLNKEEFVKKMSADIDAFFKKGGKVEDCGNRSAEPTLAEIRKRKEDKK